MAFTKEQIRTPNAIGEIKVLMSDPDPAPALATEPQTIFFEVHVKFSDGSTEVRRGNLEPHLTTAQRNSLLNFLATLRTKTTAEFLP